MIRWTFSRVASPTFDDRLITRETVRFETPDRWAMSLIVDGGLFSLIALLSEVPAQTEEILAARVVDLAQQVHAAVAGGVQPLLFVREVDRLERHREVGEEVHVGAHV